MESIQQSESQSCTHSEKENVASIHDFDFSLICEYFSSLNRQGPGSAETTKRALQCVPGFDSLSRIADIGCGSGTQTLTLAENTSATVIALDLFPQFISILNSRVKKAGVTNVRGIVGSMENLDAAGFDDNSFDLLYSEGAIYNIGFERGINEWKRYLKNGGFIACTDATWFTTDRPQEIQDFWIDAYPEIATASERISMLEKAGYIVKAVFPLEETCWTENFYEPQKKAQAAFLSKYAGNPTAESLVNSQRHEAEMYAKYHEYYGYMFYIAQKRSIVSHLK